MFHVEHNRFGVYVHVPFCLSQCAYCDFCRQTDMSLAPAYLQTVDQEMHDSPLAGLQPTTVYVGGGTPSSLGPDKLTTLLKNIARNFNLDTATDPDLGEFTVECNPDDVTPQLAYALIRGGVNRVSMGAQSLFDPALKMMGRRHKAQRVTQAIDTLHRAGIKNISVDCIFGLPKINGYNPLEDFKRFTALGVQHLSAYALQYEQGSQFTRMMEKGKLTPLPDDEVADQYALLTQTMANAGYLHYEISNYARPGHEARHNSSYWDRTEYAGFGPAASSLISGVRTTNTYNIPLYVSSHAKAKEMQETLGPDEIAEEIIMLGMRTMWGVLPTDVPEVHRAAFLKNAEKEIKLGNLCQLENGRLRIPEDRWMVSDMIIRSLTDF